MIRSLFRFSIRDVLWLTVVVGLFVGWRVNHARQKANCDYAIAAMNDEVERTRVECDWHNFGYRRAQRFQKILEQDGYKIGYGPDTGSTAVQSPTGKEWLFGGSGDGFEVYPGF